jgi:uncharacterized protein (DUF486 family)
MPDKSSLKAHVARALQNVYPIVALASATTLLLLVGSCFVLVGAWAAWAQGDGTVSATESHWIFRAAPFWGIALITFSVAVGLVRIVWRRLA